MCDWELTAVGPDFKIFWKIQIMRMISFFLPDLRLSAVGTPELRIAAQEGCGVTLIQKSGMCIAPELRIANTRVRFRCIFEDYIQSNSRRIKFGWRKTKLSQKQSIRLNIPVMVRLIQTFREVVVILCLRVSYIKYRALCISSYVP